MHSTSFKAVAIGLICTCAPATLKPQASSQPSAPSSQPTGKTFQPIDPKDATKGYFVSYDAASALLVREGHREQEAAVAKINCDERVQLTKDSQPVSAWNLWIKPTIIGVAAAVFGVAVGAGAEALKK